MHLIIYGPEGSGKGTQCKNLKEKFGLPIYTSGDLVRETALKDKGILGKACRKALLEGKYVPDRAIFQLWKNKLKTRQARSGFILDGFPRNINQAKFLLDEISNYGYQIDKVIYLKLTNKEAMKRLVARGRPLFKGSRLTHDTPRRISQRLDAYRASEKELVSFFKEKNLLLEVDGTGSIEEIFNNIIVRMTGD